MNTHSLAADKICHQQPLLNLASSPERKAFWRKPLHLASLWPASFPLGVKFRSVFMQASERLLDLFPVIIPLPVSAKFVPPSIEEVLFHAEKIGLPKIEAEKFFHYYEANGWMVGRAKMKQWHSAMAGWKLRWQERRARQSELSPSALLVKNQLELKRTEEAMKSIRMSYNDHMDWSVEDRKRFKQYRSRRDELLKLLGMEV